jgi:hypothetical protein
MDFILILAEIIVTIMYLFKGYWGVFIIMLATTVFSILSYKVKYKYSSLM